MDPEVAQAVVHWAPNCRNLAQLGRVVNEELGIEYSAGKWRGIWKDDPSLKEQCLKLLGRSSNMAPQNTLTIRAKNVKGIVFSDIHAPFHDLYALKLAAKVAKWWKPDIAIYNGDDADFYALSKFDKNPNRTFTVQEEIDDWHVYAVAPLNAAVGSNCRKVKLPGNHEDRLRRRLWANPDLFGVRNLNLYDVFQLERYGIEYVELRVRFTDLLEVSHGTLVRKWSGYTARAEMELRRYAINTITGHVHRAGSFSTRVMDRVVKAQEAPCLCSLQPEYLTDPDWVQGVTLFTIRDGKLKIEVVEFFDDYSCAVGGKWFWVN